MLIRDFPLMKFLHRVDNQSIRITLYLVRIQYFLFHGCLYHKGLSYTTVLLPTLILKHETSAKGGTHVTIWKINIPLWVLVFGLWFNTTPLSFIWTWLNSCYPCHIHFLEYMCSTDMQSSSSYFLCRNGTCSYCMTNRFKTVIRVRAFVFRN